MKIQKSLLILIVSSAVMFAQTNQGSRVKPGSVREVNVVQRPSVNYVAIVGATLIDGRGGAPITDSVVVIRGERIVEVGKRGSIKIPQDAETFDAKGLTLLPGLID